MTLKIKNKYVGKSILAFEQPMTMALIYARNLANGSELFEGLDDLKNLKYSDLLQLLSEIKLLDNRSVYVIKSNDK